MGIMKSLASILKFDTATDRFELLEVEHGSPGKCHTETTSPPKHHKRPVTVNLDDNISTLKTDFRADIGSDLIVREFIIDGTVRAALCFINGMSDADSINDYILRPAMSNGVLQGATAPLAEFLIKRVFQVCDQSNECDFDKLELAINEGQCAVFIEGESVCLLFDTRKYPQRSIQTPENEKTVLGPREGFIESLRTNITLIRRFVRTDDLVCETRICGQDNNMKIGIVYREGVANVTLIEEVKRRIANAKLKKLISTGTLEQVIENSSLSPLPQMLLTERPDRCASYLMNGHVVILCDGSPLAAILPVTLFSLLSTSEDAYARRSVGTAMRLVRFAGAAISIIIPGIFTAVVMFHQGFLSAEVLNTIVASRKMVFIPIGVELVFLLLVFQLVREAGLRVPGSIGQAIGIIGGLVLGQAAVAANLVSTVVLILVALTGLGNFCIPDYTTQLCSLYFRIALIIAGWLGGLLGITCLLLIIVAYLASLKSFGVPFLAPYAPKVFAKRPVVLRGRVDTGEGTKNDYVN